MHSFVSGRLVRVLGNDDRVIISRPDYSKMIDMVKKLRIRNWIRQSAGMLIAVNVVACSSLFPDDLELVQNAREYLEKREINAAAIELRNALQKNPGNAEARYLLGTIYLDFGDFITAEKEFRRAIEAGREDEAVLAGLARALLGQQRYAQLLDDIEARDSYSATGRANLFGLRAAANKGEDDIDQAWLMIAEGTTLDPEAVEIMKVTIQLQLHAGKQTEARETLARALQSHPRKPDLLLISAGLALQDEDYVTAEKIYQQVVDGDPPGFITFYGRRARLGQVGLLIKAGKLKQAEATLGPLFGRGTGDVQASYLSGLIAMQKGNHDLAEQRLLKLMNQTSDHTPTHLLLGTVNFAQQDYEQAAYFLEKYLSAVPQNPAARKLLGRSYMLLGQHESALESLQPALHENTDDAELLALASLSELQRGETATGIAGLEQAVAIEPDSIALRGELARAYLATGEADLAVRELEEILAKGGKQKQTETLLVLAHLRTGEFDQAINRVLEMLSINPLDPADITFAGNVFAATGDRQEARIYFERALQVEPGFPQATLSLARLEELDGNTAEAVALYTGLVDSGNKPEVPMLALARLADKQGNRQDMVGWIEQAIEKAPDEVSPRLYLASYYLREKQPEKARPLVNEAVRLSPHEAEVLKVQGRLLMAEERYQEALTPLAELVQKKPRSVAARSLLAECQLRLGRSKEARQELDTVLQQQGNNIVALALLVQLEIREGELAQALEHSQRIQQEYPGLYLGYQLEGDVRTAQQDHEDARKAYARAWEYRESAELALKRAENSSRTENPDAVVAQLQAWLSGNPDDIPARQFLGMTYQQLGQDDNAVQAYEKVLAADPENLVALNNLAWLYMQSNNPEALVLAERAYHASPESPGVIDTYGWILVQQEHATKGLRLLTQARDKLPHVPEVQYHYAVALYKTGAREDARSLLEQLMNDGEPFEGEEDARRILAELK